MRVIGLDIGSYSVKAVEIEVGLRHLEIIAFYERPIPLDRGHPKPDFLKQTVQDIFIQNHLVPPLKLVAALEGRFVSARFLTLPFMDKVKIAQTLPFELEEHIPFPLEDIVFDFKIASREAKQSTVLVLLAPKDAIDSRLKLFEGMELTPDLLTTDASALYNLTTLNWAEPEGSYAIIDCGHLETSICVIEDQSIRHLRTIISAGHHITEALAKEYDLSYDEAERAKIENGFVLTDQSNVTQDQVQFSNCIKGALSPAITHIHQTFQALRSQGKGIVNKIFLTGGTSQLRNLGQYLSEELQTEVEILKILNRYDMSNIAATDENNAKVAVPLALALGYAGRQYGDQFNFRKETFSKTQASIMGKEMKYVMTLGVLVMLILFINIIANSFILKSTHKHIDEQMAEISKKFPVKVPGNLLESQTQLRAFLGKTARDHQEQIEALGGKKGETLTTLEILNEISSIVPKEILFDVRELTIVDRRVKIQALSDSFNSIDNIEKSLKNNPQFTKVAKGEIATAADGKNKDFSLMFDVAAKKKP